MEYDVTVCPACGQDCLNSSSLIEKRDSNIIHVEDLYEARLQIRDYIRETIIEEPVLFKYMKKDIP